jgi:hypothetical protein
MQYLLLFPAICRRLLCPRKDGQFALPTSTVVVQAFAMSAESRLILSNNAPSLIMPVNFSRKLSKKLP